MTKPMGILGHLPPGGADPHPAPGAVSTTQPSSPASQPPVGVQKNAQEASAAQPTQPLVPAQAAPVSPVVLTSAASPGTTVIGPQLPLE